MSKKLLFFALLSFFSSIANAYDFEVDNIYYSITSKTDKTCAVDDNGNENTYSGNITIPAKVTYNEKEYTVTSIGSAAFKNCIKLKSISLPETLASIENYAFEGCIMLSEVTIPKSVSTLGIYVFNGCISLEKIDLGKVQTIDGVCFKGCVSLESISIPASVTRIGGYAFSGCSSLSNITLEDGKTELYIGCDNNVETYDFASIPLKSIYIGRNLTYQKVQFDYCSPFLGSQTLQNVIISDYVTNLEPHLFDGCSKLEDISGMKNVESIGEQAFYKCTSLKRFIIGNKVTKIGSNLLSKCTSLETLIIGNGIEELGSKNGRIVNGCTNLKNVYLGKGIKKIDSSSAFSDFSKTTPSSLSNANLYLFSDNLSNNYIYISTGTYDKGLVFGGIPTDVKAVYVANPERYETLLGKYYNLKPLLTFKESSLEYTGKTPALSYQNHVEGMNVSFDNSTTPKEAGSYKTNVDVCFSTDDYSTSVEIPCEYTITKAPLSVIAEDAHRSYKEENPQFACSYIGFKNGETSEALDVQPTIYTTANTESNAGTYPIYCSGAEARNYELNYKQGTLTIDKADQEITWEQEFDNVTVGDNIELTASSNSGLPVKYRSTDLSSVMISTKNGKSYAYIIKPSTVVLSAYQSGNNNYNEANDVNKFINITATGIDSITNDENTNCIYYNLNGQRIDKPAKGIVIVKTGEKVNKVLTK